MKLPREVLVQFLSFDKENWTALGYDTDSLSTSMNPTVETKRNVLGDMITDHKGFNPELAVDTYAARTEDSIYENLLDITMNRRKDEEHTTAYLLECVLNEAFNLSDNKTLNGKAWMEQVTVVPQSYGEDNSAFGIPFKVSPKGRGRTEGTVSVTNRVPTFTPGSGAETASVQQKQTTKASGSGSTPSD